MAALVGVLLMIDNSDLTHSERLPCLLEPKARQHGSGDRLDRPLPPAKAPAKVGIGAHGVHEQAMGGRVRAC